MRRATALLVASFVLGACGRTVGEFEFPPDGTGSVDDASIDDARMSDARTDGTVDGRTDGRMEPDGTPPDLDGTTMPDGDASNPAICVNDSDCPRGDLCRGNVCVASASCRFTGCSGGTTCCGDTCVDITDDTDPLNCGGCFVTCGTGEVCRSGSCCTDGADGTCSVRACLAGQTLCGDDCVDYQTDPRNCGGCRFACNAAQSCVSGHCVGSSEDGGVDSGRADGGGGDDDGGVDGSVDGGRTDSGVDGGVDGGRTDSGVDGSSGCNGGAACPAGVTCCANGCSNTDSDPTNCGGCGSVCAVGSTCTNGRCVSTPLMCAMLTADCNGLAADGCEVSTVSDPRNCGGCGRACAADQGCARSRCFNTAAVCPPGRADCDLDAATGCEVDLATNGLNCGVCGNGCASGRCVAGVCQPPVSMCAAGTLDCNALATDGCEVTSGTDARNCGGCGNACVTGARCVNGACLPPDVMCAPGRFDCNGSTTDGCEVDGTTDVTNCGGCGLRCPFPSAQVCTMGRCQSAVTCTGALLDCNLLPADGCEVDGSTDARNCGTCGHACNTGSMCVAGTCAGGPITCPAGRLDCNGAATDGCEIDGAIDAANCGACGLRCGADALCVGSMCTTLSCPAGRFDCDRLASTGCEVDGSSDPSHCGACNVSCTVGQRCVTGACTTNDEGAFEPTVNPTVLTPGVHRYTTVHIPAGVAVFVAGSGSDAATLDIEASGAVRIEGRLDVSGGDGTQNTIASRSTQQGRAGSGGFAGELRASPSSAACAYVAGVGGINGVMTAGSLGTCSTVPTDTCTDQQTQQAFVFATLPAQFGGGGGVFTGFRAYGGGGGGPAGGAPGALGATYTGERDCTGASGGGGATAGHGGGASLATAFRGADGTLGQTQCAAIIQGNLPRDIPPAWVGGGGGGSIGTTAASDLAVTGTFQPGSGGGGGSADYLQRPAYGGTSGGGGGGGALRVGSPVSITITGQVLANGGAGGDAYIGTGMNAGCDPQPGAAGGGGSGGVIFLASPSITVSGTVSAQGGPGGAASVFATGGNGGDGGNGRVRLSVDLARCAISGTVTPAPPGGCRVAGASAAGAYVAAYPN